MHAKPMSTDMSRCVLATQELKSTVEAYMHDSLELEEPLPMLDKIKQVFMSTYKWKVQEKQQAKTTSFFGLQQMFFKISRLLLWSVMWIIQIHLSNVESLDEEFDFNCFGLNDKALDGLASSY